MYFIDHYDSFSHNVIDWLSAGDSDIQVHHLQYDDKSSLKQFDDRPLPLVLSPGPRHPNDAATTLDLVRSFLGKVPILGVCLGHQILGVVGGFSITKASHPFHGSTQDITITNPGILFAGVPSRFKAATYNSLVVKQDPHKKTSFEWDINAVNQHGEIQALTWLKSNAEPAFGVQFHPESFLTEEKLKLRQNWLSVVERFNASKESSQSKV
jgi:anthranilate synthase/aminodeoxychorismate synthase-like glutamine amidotransferase